MGSTETLREIRLGAGEIAGCVALVAEVGWNQTADDWRIMLALGEGYGLVAPDGRLVATSLALPYASGGFGWISMVLVTGPWRRKGLATRVTDRAMAALAQAGLVAILDATPAGRTVYGLLGFEDTWGIERMQSLAAPTPAGVPRLAPGSEIRPMTDADWPAVCALDAAAFCADRAHLLADLHQRLPVAALVSLVDGRINGFLLGRDGRTATQLGPCVAADEDGAIALLAAALRRVSAPVFLDMPAPHVRLGAWLRNTGFSLQRPYTRMILKRRTPFNPTVNMFAIAGPELG